MGFGPDWKTEARGVWRRDHRRTGSSADSRIPYTLRVREVQGGQAYAWNVHKGQTLLRSGTSTSLDEACEHCESVASAGATPSPVRRTATPTQARSLMKQAPPDNGARFGAWAFVVAAWAAILFAAWRGIPVGIGGFVLLAVVTVVMFYVLEIRRSLQ